PDDDAQDHAGDDPRPPAARSPGGPRIAAPDRITPALRRHPVHGGATACVAVLQSPVMVTDDRGGRGGAMFRLCVSPRHRRLWTVETVVVGPGFPNESPSQPGIPDDWAALVPDPSENIRVALFVV